MKIEHRFGVNLDANQRAQLRTYGLEFDTGFTVIVIDEQHRSWNEISRLVEAWGCADVVGTKFTKKEERDAPWLRLNGSWHHGYPLPEDFDDFLRATYNIDNYCSVCGCGAVQNDAFLFSAEPKWGKKSFVQLNGVPDEFFVTREIAESLFRDFDISCRDVRTIGGRILETVVQLVVDELVEIEADGLLGELCGDCKCIRYSPSVRGYFPRMKSAPRGHICKTNQSFGSGLDCHKAVVISNALAMALRENLVKGISFEPLAHDGV